MSDLKSARLAVRVTPADEALIRQAADEQGQTLTEFTVQAAVHQAKQVLADRRVFILSDQAWASFTVMLDEPVRSNPALSRLLNRPSVFDA
ncbi:MAG: DUF1778 domain-containing protein [Propionicimonas sp.]|uniref:type II toxin-antitoxin system TacA family antitoxin n=1 Tax=Propionicimonas sp. TaxID=1955623 RepID=UPI001D913BD8|nr:DUF1778 domain-containing protein [Propionicimonas sp.]MBU4186738.1 DUF1778 domain-containing protein [Actinomycetota bacterium]MBU4206068.1 DUF1778 domain-containing protein [Actinomycetota bacterium]MBU4364758.1 DUF1778 domain-containing protein [Actinomycetota bacterium]MBU4410594.1 DUF1778 domain-containing protein [Actinomycetota bacterium]MBU4417621.1 DUF1778 domain-containing protein [Actinomycetota bacterium]